MSDNDPIPYILVDRPPKPGDRVRVEFDAKYVRDQGSFGGHVVEFNLPGYSDYWSSVPVGSVEVIVEPVKVGDKVTLEVLDALPENSAVMARGELVAQRISPSGGALEWRTTIDNKPINPAWIANQWQATVLHIGGKR